MSKQAWSKAEINFVLKLHVRGLSRKEIARQFNERFEPSRSQDSVKHCIDIHGDKVEKYTPKVLIIKILPSNVRFLEFQSIILCSNLLILSVMF